MWCNNLVRWCKKSTFAPHLKHALIIELGLKGLTIVKRTNKAEGTIRLRFRLRDGRGVDLYHKSEIDADLNDLDKFSDTGELKPRVSVYNKKLKRRNGNADDKLRWYQETWTWYLKVFLKDETIILVLFDKFCYFLLYYLLSCNIIIIFAHETPINNRFLIKMKEYTHYNRIKSVLAEKNKTGTWLSEQMGRNLGTVSRWMTNKVQPSVEQLYEIAHHLDMDVKDLLVSSK